MCWLTGEAPRFEGPVLGIRAICIHLSFLFGSPGFSRDHGHWQLLNHPLPAPFDLKKDRFWVQAPCNLTYRLCQPWSIMQNFRGAKSSILSKNFFCTPYSHKGGFTKLVTLKVLVIEKVLTLKVRWSRVIRQQWLLDKDVLWSFLFLADVTSLPPLTHEPQPVG